MAEGDKLTSEINMLVLKQMATVERDLTTLLLGLAAQQGWPVVSTIKAQREILTKATGGTDHDVLLRKAYIARYDDIIGQMGALEKVEGMKMSPATRVQPN